MPYTTSGEFDFSSGRLRKRRRFDPSDPFADDDELLPEEEDEEWLPGTAESPLPSRANAPAGPSLPEPPSFAPVMPSTLPIGPGASAPPAPPRPSRSALDTYADVIRGMPQRPRPGKLQGALATGVAALGGFYGHRIPAEQTQRAVEGVLYPGFGRQMEDWERQAKATGALADIEARQAHERRLEAQHQAAMRSEEAQLASERARQEYYRSRQNMPPKPERFQTYEAYLVSKVQSGTPEERAAAQKKLDELKAKNSPEKNLIVKEVEDEIGGTKTLVFFDPVTGEKKKEEKFTARKRPAGTSPLSTNTLEYRQKLSKARELAGEALRKFPNDKAKARDWLAQQTNDDEIFEMALERIGAPPATRKSRLAEAKAALGIVDDSTASGSPPAGGNPYRQPKQ